MVPNRRSLRHPWLVRPHSRGGALMCINRGLCRDGLSIACRKCWQCIEAKQNDWAGRCIAESKTATATYTIGLTYGENTVGEKMHERAAVLTYSDVQNYFKLMRFNGFKFKYLAVGEYGSKKGRAHWHLIVFFEGEVPEHKPSTATRKIRFHEKHWPHGFSQWRKVSDGEAGAVRYACKYVYKDLGDDAAQARLAVSKKPPLGTTYFAQLAQRHVDAGLSPSDLFYTFPGVLNTEGKKIEFFLHNRSRSAELYIQEFVTRWEKQRPGEHWPHSEVVDYFLDRWAKYDPDIRVSNWQSHPPPRSHPMPGSTAFFDRDVGLYVCTSFAGNLWYWMPDNKGKKLEWQRNGGMTREEIKRSAEHRFQTRLRDRGRA